MEFLVGLLSSSDTAYLFLAWAKLAKIRNFERHLLHALKDILETMKTGMLGWVGLHTDMHKDSQ